MRRRKKVPKRLKEQVAKRANFRCEYCRCSDLAATQAHSADHVDPFSLGGETDFSNLAYVCQGCNGRKYNKQFVTDPISQRQVSIFNPRQNQWQDHFRWSNDKLKIIGITAIGRATVDTLALNRPRLQAWRHDALITGRHDLST